MTTPEQEFIDVRKLISDFDLREHIERADAYFATLTEDDWRLRRPFTQTEMTGTSLTRLGNMFAAADLYPGVTVLDFGCATGWLTRMLAGMNCDAIGIDVSEVVLLAADRYAQKHHPELQKLLRWQLFDGERIDLPDGSVDRVLCHDVFHHVPNQLQILREFRRILRSDGRAVFSEPGPNHSRSADAQAEMREFGVIENDIIVEDVERLALEAGFAQVQLSLFSLEPRQMPVADFLALTVAEAPAAPPQPDTTFRQLLWPTLTSIRAMVMYATPDAMQPNSRKAAYCNGEITVQAVTPLPKGFKVHVIIRNSGAGSWLPSGHTHGSVNLGMQSTQDGALNMSPFRHPFLVEPLAPGASVETTFEWTQPLPPDATLQFGLVSEYVCWFPPSSYCSLNPPQA
jgi:SAM-dependent methyltransferase